MDAAEALKSTVEAERNPRPKSGTVPPKISMVIPVYDDYENLESCFAEVTKALNEFGHTWEIVFIDDFSKDGSLQKLLEFAKKEPRITVVEHYRNQGAVKAILTGLKNSRGDIVIPFDPDLQFAPECISQLATQVMNGYDFVGGIRVGRNDTFGKKLTSFIASNLINICMGIKQKDFGSIKAYSRRVVDGIVRLPQDYMSIQAAAYTISRNFIEIPIRHQARTIGVSKWTFFMRLDFFLDIYASYARHPFDTLLIGGLVASGVSVVSGVALVVAFIAMHWSFDPQRAALVILNIVAFLAGLNITAVALVGQFAVRALRRKFQVDDAGSRVHCFRDAESK